jgi:7-cyano-7-deazaguanine synthase in queuosine biosynthesis
MTTDTPKAPPVVRVAVLENGQRAPANWQPCIIGSNLDFSTDRLESYCLASWKEIVFDALIVAAAVEFCDRIQKRPALSWGRDFYLTIPVHDVAHWNSKPVHAALIEALEFLTGDKWQIEFAPRRKPHEVNRQSYLAIPLDITTIIPFSDGIDSRAVSALQEKELGSKVCRVQLGPRKEKKHRPGQERRPFTAVPYEVKTGKRSSESTSRSRGFKFATVSGIAAYLVGATEIVVPESGQGALGPVLVPTGQGYEDYRNHPFFTDRMERYFKALFGIDVHFIFPRLWFTKGETLAAYAALHGKNAHVDARSCWQQNRHVPVDEHRRQCGICAACMLRRLSVHAADLKEPRETYVWESLDAPTFESGAAKGFDKEKITTALHEYAIAGTLHLDHLAGLQKSALHSGAIKRQAYHLAKSQGLSPEEAEAKLRRLLSKHESEWQSFVQSLSKKSFIRNWVASAA